MRADSAFYAAKVIAACRRHQVRFSITVPVTAQVRAAIATIDEHAWTDVEKQPTLEDVFLAIVGDDGKDGDAGNDRSAGTDESRTSKEQR